MNHSHVLYDSDPHFKIDPITRKITNESSRKTTLMQYDHKSERFTFEMPRHVESHDMSTCNIVEIQYLNIEANTKAVKAGVYTVDDLQISGDDEDTVVCSWLVPFNATQFAGQLNFLIRFSCTDNETGEIEYAWSTAPYSGIMVSQGIYNTNTSSDNPVPAFNFVTTVNGRVLKFFVGTTAEWEALPEKDENTIHWVTDDRTFAEVAEAINNLNESFTELETALKLGTFVVRNAETANKATTLDSGNWTEVTKLPSAGCYVLRVSYNAQQYTTIAFYDGKNASVCPSFVSVKKISTTSAGADTYGIESITVVINPNGSFYAWRYYYNNELSAGAPQISTSSYTIQAKKLF